MLLILSWLVVYGLVLLGIHRVAGSLRERRLFKVLFFPGTALAAGIQALCARLAVSSSYRVSLLGEGRPAFAFERERLPCLSGALFMTLCQGTLFAAFLGLALRLDAAALLDAQAVSLPALYPEKLAEGWVDLDFRGYLAGLSCLAAGAREHPWTALLLLWLAAGTFASLRLTAREWRWAMLALGVAALVAAVAEWFGAGFPFLSRGWWARFSFFPRSWALFSLFFTLSWLSLCLFAVLGVLHGAWGALRPSRSGGEGKGSGDGRRG